MTDEGNLQSLKLWYICDEFGWSLYDEENDYHYYYDAGSYCIHFNYYYYNDITVGYLNDKTRQIKGCDFRFTPPGEPNGSLYDSNSTDYSKKNVSIDYRPAPDKLQMTLLPSAYVSISRDDAILLVYLLTSVKKYPGENPFYYLGGSINDYLSGTTSSANYVFP